MNPSNLALFKPWATRDNGSSQEFSYLLGTWESSNTTVATVNRAGVLEALTEGVTELTFTSHGVASTPWEVTVFGP
jgi:hypothetical protein